MARGSADMTARERTLSAIRTGLGVSGSDKIRASTAAERLKHHPSGTVPARAKGEIENLATLFADMLEGQAASLDWIAREEDVPEAVARYLRDLNLAARVRIGEDEMLSGLPWKKAGALEIASGPAEPSDTTGITRAQVGAAETGTLFLTSGSDNPTTLNFLPETHIAVIRKSDIVGGYEDAWNRLRKSYGEGTLPRNVNLISGPSRTADIEQTMVMGAHGPRRLHVIVVG
jgi:L-lactate dehydrogenase complex protein LldG